MDYLLFGIPDDCLQESPEELNTAEPLTNADKTEVLTALSEIISGLSPHLFNEIVLEIGTKYERSPPHRVFIGKLFTLITEKISPEIELDRDRVLIKPILVDAALIMFIGVAGSAGKGVIMGGSWHLLQKVHAAFHGQTPVQGLQAFKEILKLIFTSISKDKKILLWGSATAAAYGSIDAVLAQVEEKKLDPMIVLEASIQASILQLWQWLVDRQDELIILEQALVNSNPLSHEEAEFIFQKSHKKISEIEETIRKKEIKTQLLFFYEQATEHRFKIETMAQDYDDLRGKIKLLGEQLTGLELRRASMEDAPPQSTQNH